MSDIQQPQPACDKNKHFGGRYDGGRSRPKGLCRSHGSCVAVASWDNVQDRFQNFWYESQKCVNTDLRLKKKHQNPPLKVIVQLQWPLKERFKFQYTIYSETVIFFLDGYRTVKMSDCAAR